MPTAFSEVETPTRRDTLRTQDEFTICEAPPRATSSYICVSAFKRDAMPVVSPISSPPATAVCWRASCSLVLGVLRTAFPCGESAWNRRSSLTTTRMYRVGALRSSYSAVDLSVCNLHLFALQVLLSERLGDSDVHHQGGAISIRKTFLIEKFWNSAPHPGHATKTCRFPMSRAIHVALSLSFGEPSEAIAQYIC